MSEQLKQQLQGSSATVFGVLLITLGVLFLAGLWFRIDVGHWGVTDHWASWAYAWALIGSAAFGVGKMVYGSAKNDHQAVAEGARIGGIGLIIFLAGLGFFELIIGIGGFGLSAWGWPIVLIVIGAALMVHSLSGATRKAS
jgi:hypothetical protein